jgi:hypothetical protein
MDNVALITGASYFTVVLLAVFLAWLDKRYGKH